MKNRPLRSLFLFLTVCLTVAFCIPSVGAASGGKASDYLKKQTAIAARSSKDTVRFTNSDNGFVVRIVDEEDLLTPREIMLLSNDISDLTDYGDVIFWSCSVTEEQQQEQLDIWQNEKDGSVRSTCIMVINFETGYIHIYTGGDFHRKTKQKKLQEITDGIIPYINDGEYYTAVKEGFSQVSYQVTGKQPPKTEAATEPADKVIPKDEAVRYENPDTGYQVMILDNADLISDIEEAMLADTMQPITEYGSIIFWSTNERTSDSEAQARKKRYSYYGYDSAGILAINMATRKVTFHADGAMYNAVSASDARSITDNVSHYASEKDYYTCAKEAFSQVLMRLRGQAIAEPMKYTSYVVISLMLAFVIVVGLVFGRFNPLSKRNHKQANLYGSGTALASPPKIRKTGSETRAWVTVLMIFLSSLGPGGGGGGRSGGGGGGSSGGGGGGSSSF